MSDKEKLEAIKNGKDIDEETVVVLQSTDFAKEKKEEVKEEETPSIEAVEKNKEEQNDDVSVNLEPDVKIGADVPSVELPTEPVITPQVEEKVVPTPDTTPFSINLDGLNLGNDQENQAPLTNIPTPDTASFEQPVQSNNFDFNNNMTTNNFDNNIPANDFNQDSYDNVNTTASSDLFSNVYDSVSDDTKTIAAIVTEQDEVNAKNANMQAYERLYDAGPGKQINILRKFSEEAAKWIRAADKSGFVSGEMHDIAKKILREYEGLKEEQNEFFDDNKIVPFKSSYNEQQVNQFGDVNNINNDNMIQFPQNNFENNNFKMGA